MTKRLETMKELLMSCIEGQMTHLDRVDTEELGEAIDMVKDLSEAIYYCTITEAMEEKSDQWTRGGSMDEGRMYYGEGGHNMGGNYGMYARGGNSSSGSSNNSSGGNSSSNSGGGRSGSSSYYTEREYPYEFRDSREGRSPRSRRMYMEAKETHMDKTSQMRELEKYMQELTQDVIEMVEGSSSEEKQYLSKRVSALATKISQLND